MRLFRRGEGAAPAASAIDEARANTQAVTAVVRALAEATTLDAAARAALAAVRACFGWAYGSYWRVDPATQSLRFALESGDAGEEFRRVTLAASFREGVGLSGRAWKARDLVFVQDLGDVKDCVRAPVAQKVGVRSGICFPITDAGKVVGTMDFFATETLELSEERLDTLRSVGVLVSQALERVAQTERQEAAALDVAAMDLFVAPPLVLTCSMSSSSFDWSAENLSG